MYEKITDMEQSYSMEPRQKINKNKLKIIEDEL